MKTDVRFDFDKYYTKIFEKLKARIISSEILKYYNFYLFCKIETNVFDKIIISIFFNNILTANNIQLLTFRKL